MFKLNLIFVVFLVLFVLLLLIFMNSSFCLILNVNYVYVNLFMNYTSLWFLFFMTFIMYMLIYLLSKKVVSYNKYFYVLTSYIFIYLFVSFIMIMDDFVSFMILFEGLFFPMCFVSLFFNFNNRFIFAMFYLMMFSSMSSIFCIIVIMMIVFHFNVINLQFFLDICFLDSMYLILYVWICLFMIFGIKYPMWPLHIWLPELHVEVNTEMSVLLASIVLKMGFFGVFKFIFLMFNQMSMWFLGFMDTLMLLGLFFLAMTLLFLSDYKKIMAHWSVLHTGMGLILLWHNDMLFMALLYLCNLAHMLSSAFMFMIIGYMYDNYGMRIFLLLVSFFGMSIWSSMFLALFLFNMDFPFMLLFYIDMFMLYGLVSLSMMYIVFFCVLVLTIFISSMYIYMCLTYYSFIWMDKYLSLDLTINDMYVTIVMFFMVALFFYLIYLLF